MKNSPSAGACCLIGALNIFALLQVVYMTGTANSFLSFLSEYQTSFTIQNNNSVGATTTIKKKNSQRISLPDLVDITKQVQCPTDMYPVEQIHNVEAEKADNKGLRKIPRIVHMTGKTSCLTKPFYDNMKLWSFENHSFYFHDDNAVDKLFFDRDWPMFPQLKNTIECLKDAGGAAKADLWRYLVLWEYGGIYTDMDNAPGIHMNATTIAPDIDAFFVQERGGFLSQYFFAISPHHPLMFLAVHDVMRNMHETANTGAINVPVVTGPGTTKRAFVQFMGYSSATDEAERDRIYKLYAKPNAGHYIGKISPHHSVTVVGTRMTSGEWCLRSNIHGGLKKQQWVAMNITDYRQTSEVKTTKTMSCIMAIYNKYRTEYFPEQQLIEPWELYG